MATGITIRGDLRKRTVEGLRAGIEAGYARAANYVLADLKVNAFSAPPKPPGLAYGMASLFRGSSSQPNALSAPSGDTRRTLTAQTFRLPRGKRGGLTTMAAIGSPVKWLRAHEEGKTIRGRPWLKIPTIYFRRYGENEGFWLMSNKGNLWRMATRGKGKPVPIFLLKREVELPKREMFATSVKRTKAQVLAFVDDAIRSVVAG